MATASLPATAPRTITRAEFLALPDDGVERWVINGILREKRDDAMTRRNRFHCRVTARVTRFLDEWNDTQARPGEVLTGEAGVILGDDPLNAVGIDVAYVTADVLAGQAEDTTMIDGTPLLAVEVLSPSDTQQEIREKINNYLGAGVALVWVIDPYLRTVTVFQPDAAPRLVNDTQDLSGEPHLPGFWVPAAKLF